MGEHKQNPRANAKAAGMLGPKANGGKPQQINIDMNDLPQLACTQCGCTDLILRLRLREVPELLRFAIGGHRYVNEQMHVCLGCGAEQNPDDMRRLDPVNRAGRKNDEAASDEKPRKPLIEVVR